MPLPALIAAAQAIDIKVVFSILCQLLRSRTALGRDGIFAGRAAQLDRAYAISAARSLGDSMRQIGEAERRGEGQFRDNVTAQMRSRRT